MDISTKKIDEANVVVNAKIKKDDIEKNINEIAKKLSKSLNLPGFRKGKVPLAVVKKRYKENIEKDAETKALEEVYSKAINELGINKDDILGEPIVAKFEKGDQDIDAEIKISIKPKIDLDGYEEAIPTFEEPKVSEEEVEKRLNELATAMAPIKKLQEDRGLQEGDIAVIDFKGYVDGKELDGGSAQDFQLKIGSNQFIEGFEEQLIGMKPSETKEIEVTFPKDYHNKDIANKKAKFTVTLKEIQIKEEPKIDEELAKKILPDEENVNLEILKEKIKEQLKSEKLSKLYNEELKPKLIENLVEKFNFNLPQNIVEQEIDIKFNEKLRTLTKEELDELKNNSEKIKEIRDSLKEEAQKSVKATFIVDALAKEEKISVDDQEVVQTIYYEAMQMGQNPQEVLKNYQTQGLLPAIKMAMIEDKLLTQLLNKKMESK